MIVIAVELFIVFSGLTFGFAFGWLLQRGRVTEYDVIVNQFLLRDFTVIKVMLTAIIVGGIGVFALNQAGWATYHVKDANLLAVGLGGAIFAIGMVVYGYCPGTGLAAIGTGSVHALVGACGMIGGAMLYALAYDWLRDRILPIWAFGKARLPDLTGVPDLVWFIGLTGLTLALFAYIENPGTSPQTRRDRRQRG